jgi:hypothetical protein
MTSIFRITRRAAVGAGVLALAISWLALPQRAAAEPPPDDAGKATYIGASECKKCHFKQFKTWKETKMAKAMDALKPGEAKEAKAKAGLDAAKDYTTEEKCVKCHVTGMGEPGGYDPKGDEAHKAGREGVQCEVCHGPGSLYNAYMKEHEKAGYNKEEAAKLGLKMFDEKTCAACHHGGPDGSPTMAADAKFDAAAKAKEEGAIHAHPKK